MEEIRRGPGRPRKTSARDGLIEKYGSHGYRILSGESMAAGGVPPEDLSNEDLESLVRLMEKEKGRGWLWPGLR